MANTFIIYNFGCRVNQSETDILIRRLLASGYSLKEDKPELIVLNSCAVTKKAEKEVLQFIRSKRRKFPLAKIVIVGCAATKWIKEKKIIAEANALVPHSEKENLFDVIGKIDSVGMANKSVQTDKYSESGRMLIKIQDGCDYYCTYCLVPYLRGKSKSKKTEEIIKEVKNLIGIKEIILTSINSDLFGVDNGEKISDLINRLVEETEIERISFGSINPGSINKDLITVFNSPRMIKFFHIPIQSGSNKILGLMNRNYKVKDVKKKLEMVSQLYPLVSIGTDIIVGFPGETNDDFEQTFKFLEESPISKFHLFRFSKREGTAAVKLSESLGEPDEKLKKERLKLLEELGLKKYNKFLMSHIGKKFEALFLVAKKNGYQKIILDNNIPALVKVNKDYRGEIKKVKILRFTNNELIGEMIND